MFSVSLFALSVGNSNFRFVGARFLAPSVCLMCGCRRVAFLVARFQLRFLVACPFRVQPVFQYALFLFRSASFCCCATARFCTFQVRDLLAFKFQLRSFSCSASFPACPFPVPICQFLLLRDCPFPFCDCPFSAFSCVPLFVSAHSFLARDFFHLYQTTCCHSLFIYLPKNHW